MSILDVIFGTPANVADYYGDEVVLGPVLSEGESLSTDVTDNAIEDGSNVTDHVHNKPATFTVKTFLADQNDLVKAAMGALFGANKSVTEKIIMLKTWRDTKTLLKYSGPVFSGFFSDGYDMFIGNVLITGLEISRDTGTGSGVDVSISFKQVVFATAVFEDINLPKGAKKVKNKGTTPLQTGDTGAVKKSSFLAKVF